MSCRLFIDGKMVEAAAQTMSEWKRIFLFIVVTMQKYEERETDDTATKCMNHCDLFDLYSNYHCHFYFDFDLL